MNIIIFGELFSHGSFFDFSRQKNKQIADEIQNYDAETVLNTSVKELVEHFREKYTINTPILKREDKYLPNEAKKVNKPEKYLNEWDEMESRNQPFIQFTVCIPFEGDSDLLKFSPSSCSYSLSSKNTDIQIKNQEIQIFYDIRNDDENDINEVYEKDIKDIESISGSLSSDVESFNKSLPDFIKQQVENRKDVAEKSRSKMQSINIPIKKRKDLS